MRHRQKIVRPPELSFSTGFTEMTRATPRPCETLTVENRRYTHDPVVGVIAVFDLDLVALVQSRFLS